MMEEKEPKLFIKVENYREVAELMRIIKRKIDEAKSTLEKIYAIKSEEDVKIEEWDDLLRDLEKKTSFIDETLLESKG